MLSTARIAEMKSMWMPVVHLKLSQRNSMTQSFCILLLILYTPVQVLANAITSPDAGHLLSSHRARSLES